MYKYYFWLKLRDKQIKSNINDSMTLILDFIMYY